jgi:hypothetical protein
VLEEKELRRNPKKQTVLSLRELTLRRTSVDGGSFEPGPLSMIPKRARTSLRFVALRVGSDRARTEIMLEQKSDRVISLD